MVSRPVWLGYKATGGRLSITPEELRGGIALMGQGANDLAATLAYAFQEAGLRTLVLDLTGGVADRLSGYTKTYLPSFFLYDSLRIEERDDDRTAGLHAQLAASAYSCALDLSFEQEGIVNAAMQIIASERGVASPSAVGDLMMERDQQFKGKPADRFRARLTSLTTLNVIGEAGAVDELLRESAILDFGNAGQPEAIEAAVALFIAKMIAILSRQEAGAGNSGQVSLPDVVIMTHANRLFRVRPIFRRTERLLTAFIAADVPKVLASESRYGLDEHFRETCAIKVMASAVWNEETNSRPLQAEAHQSTILLPNVFMVRHHPYGHDIPFIPREFEPKRGTPITQSSTTTTATTPATEAPGADGGDDTELIRLILEDVKMYEAPTRQSIVSFASQGYERGRIERTIDMLQSEGYVEAVKREDLRAGPPISTLTLTAKGLSMLEMMK